jgi:hypothetical protein
VVTRVIVAVFRDKALPVSKPALLLLRSFKGCHLGDADATDGVKREAYEAAAALSVAGLPAFNLEPTFDGGRWVPETSQSPMAP